jgi:hypothetical protein
VVELFRCHPQLAQQLQLALAESKDPERLLPKAASALKALVTGGQQKQQEELLASGWQGAGGVEAADPADAAWATAWKAMQQLPECLARWGGRFSKYCRAAKV